MLGVEEEAAGCGAGRVCVCGAARRGEERRGLELRAAAGGREAAGGLAPPRRSHWAAGPAVTAARPGRGKNGDAGGPGAAAAAAASSGKGVRSGGAATPGPPRPPPSAGAGKQAAGPGPGRAGAAPDPPWQRPPPLTAAGPGTTDPSLVSAASAASPPPWKHGILLHPWRGCPVPCLARGGRAPGGTSVSPGGLEPACGFLPAGSRSESVKVTARVPCRPVPTDKTAWASTRGLRLPVIITVSSTQIKASKKRVPALLPWVCPLPSWPLCSPSRCAVAGDSGLCWVSAGYRGCLRTRPKGTLPAITRRSSTARCFIVCIN
ncbi:spidroin-2-like [Aquila chrysaetos chrysaetos]|uniref:spidroin-2-like n=1 Tax=Aquila chrysaetos chrysaetos TaxID=223781 RepID=UPI0011772749|nr:spidroin-2-like [Aquila chrysaetos chrysaetos]